MCLNCNVNNDFIYDFCLFIEHNSGLIQCHANNVSNLILEIELNFFFISKNTKIEVCYKCALMFNVEQINDKKQKFFLS